MNKDNIIWLLLFFACLASMFFVGYKVHEDISNTGRDTTRTIVQRFDSTIHVITSTPGTTSTNEHTIIKSDSTVYMVPVIDTAAIHQIIESWFTHYYYAQTLRDSNIEATISDSIAQNRITHRKFSYKILRPDSIVTLTITQPKNNTNLYAGMGVCWGTSPKIGPALFLNRDRFGLQVGAGFGNQQPVLSFGAYFKFK